MLKYIHTISSKTITIEDALKCVSDDLNDDKLPLDQPDDLNDEKLPLHQPNTSYNKLWGVDQPDGMKPQYTGNGITYLTTYVFFVKYLVQYNLNIMMPYGSLNFDVLI